jgi:4-hydroxybenzoyl-CoA reductase subunit beta
MDALPDFRVLHPATLDEAIAAQAAHPDAKPLGGGTDLVVNIRRGIVAPPVLIALNRIEELHAIHADASRLEIGAAVTLAQLAEHPGVIAHYPVVAQRRAYRRSHPPQHGHSRRQFVSRHALHLLQPERMVA